MSRKTDIEKIHENWMRQIREKRKGKLTVAIRGNKFEITDLERPGFFLDWKECVLEATPIWKP